ncbi:conserved hypothetical protein [Theileria orientalis strain Shintoku]|uniref:Uncharacterized protein n=1 Tax=Theileria orientalis strain Shintoku TaxID=869250 RepID=J4D847_THEOR|nr:conserved hypothetical protein [Theileria orientalis strain Shintoku]BAM40565.1 conserved hypothetical protein [Theileria orientalis strain Shintoku]|eukprot:XP_009690866.1 conserved hypothetical protein [Theileria orientalis strain Shintoku]
MVSFSNTVVLYSLFCFGNLVYCHFSGRRGDKKSLVTLNVQNKKTTSDYIFYSIVDHSVGDVATFSAYGTTVFNEVKDGKSLVWKSSNEKEYSTKVVIEGDKLLIKCPRTHILFLKQDDGTWKPKDLDRAAGEKAADAAAPQEGGLPVKDVRAENAELRLRVAKLEETLVQLKMEYDQFRSKVLSVDNRIGEVAEALCGL